MNAHTLRAGLVLGLAPLLTACATNALRYQQLREEAGGPLSALAPPTALDLPGQFPQLGHAPETLPEA